MKDTEKNCNEIDIKTPMAFFWCAIHAEKQVACPRLIKASGSSGTPCNTVSIWKQMWETKRPVAKVKR